MILKVIAALGIIAIALNVWLNLLNSHEENRNKLQAVEFCVWGVLTMICSYIKAVSSNCAGLGAILGVWVANLTVIILVCGIIIGIKRLINKKGIMRFALNALWIVSTFIFAINLLPQ